ncbi:hypothetical protein KP509_17G022600 [Ceratopteris richardii]|uniref:Uncharacterized protein n=1 Tax=Ceratopteris richardii TaxID=49495 RepID=A0A8T2SSR6_CERRI|nr:hypothetical protein KP509_17G022600 [Ceratopteris richardii]
MAIDVAFQFDPDFEFSAPHFYDFTAPESSAQVAEAESWFETSASHDASPFSIHSRDVHLISVDNEDESDGEQMDTSSSQNGDTELSRHLVNAGDVGFEIGGFSSRNLELSLHTPEVSKSRAIQQPTLASPNSLPAKRDHMEMSHKAPFTEKPGSRFVKGHTLRPTQNLNTVQALKRQKLEGGLLKKIVPTNERNCNRTTGSLTVPKAFNFRTEKRLIAAKRENAPSSLAGKSSSPFISVAEKVRRFEMKTRDISLGRDSYNDDAGQEKEKSKLKLTRPKEPELGTSQRTRPARVKSTAELEAEMLAKIPKFKARPLNRKILEAPALLPVPKSTPSLPEFQEFHLRTMERALQHAGTASLASVSSTDSAAVDEFKSHRKSAPGNRHVEVHEPHLETAARARPPKVKSSEEREQEELAKIPKFKARPLDKKIFWSRGDLGIFRNTKREVTTPVEFHFATDERNQSQHQTQIPFDLFSKLSLNSQQESHPPALTKPEPFHLLTEDRGQKKLERMLVELNEQQQKELEQRIPKAHPLPCTTDYPEVPPKPQPKECTVPQPFCLESVIRHETEMLRMADENRRLEEEEMELRKFRAQPISCGGPVFVPERSRKPLTEVQEFTLQVDTRAVERAEFDKKVAEKQNSYKRFREEYEAVRKAEEERLIKSLRRTMVPQALPLPHFDKPFVPKRSSKELTRPRSPKLSLLHNRRERRSSLTFNRRSSTFTIQKRVQMR